MVRFGATPRTKKKMSGGVSQQFCVRWNSHLGSLGAAFPQLLAGQRFVDVTLACEGHQVHCHRLVLAACSSFFESLLGENPCKHPIIILPRDIKLWEIQALVDFMYKGEVNVSQAGLPDLLKCAEILQIRGLCGSDAALNLNQITTSTPVSTTSNTIGVQHNNSIINKNSNLNNNSTTTNAITTTPPAIHNNNNFINNNIHNVASSAAAAESSPNIITPIIKNVTSSTNIPVSCSTPISSSTYNNLRRDNENSLSAITVQPTIMVPPIDFDDDDGDDDSLNGSDLMDEMELKIKEDYSDEHNTIVKMEPEKEYSSQSTTTTDQQQQQHLRDNNLSKKTTATTSFQQNLSYNKVSTLPTTICGKIRVKSNENLFENYKLQRHHPISPYNLNKKNKKTIGVNESKTKINKKTNKKLKCIYKNTINNCETTTTTTTTTTAKIFPSTTLVTATTTALQSPKSSIAKQKKLFLSSSPYCSSSTTINSFDNNNINNHKKDNQLLLPSSLKFNKNSMSIFVTKNSKKTSKAHDNSHQLINNNDDNTTDVDADDNVAIDLNKHCNDNNGDDDYDYQKTEINSCNDDNCENIICSPNFIELTFDDDDEDIDDDIDDDYGDDRNTDELLTEINIHSYHNNDSSTMIDSGVIISNDDDDENDDNNDIETDNNINYNNENNIKITTINNTLPPLIPFGNNNVATTNPNDIQIINLQNIKKTSTDIKEIVKDCSNDDDKKMVEINNSNNGTRPPTFVLRNPRGNQPRSYNTDALWAALMDVKAGESIYRASQLHKVPRKTLRNWMKRWDIKSAYPMPQQLRQAAEKRKIKNQI